MSNYKNVCPPELFDDDEYDENSYSCRQPTSQNQPGIKIIKPIGQNAGLNKSNFNIQLDPNAQKWFDQIHQYWRQCKVCF